MQHLMYYFVFMMKLVPKKVAVRRILRSGLGKSQKDISPMSFFI